MFKKVSLLFLFSVGFLMLKAQEKIPFRITKHNNIIVKTLINDKDSLDLMFQIAMEGGSISPERQRKADHIIFKDEISENNTVKIGKLIIKNVQFFDNELTGHEADGKIGTGIFAGKTFKIDYDNNQFVIYDEKPDLKGYESMPLFSENGQFYIVADNVIDNEQQEVYFLLQSGYSGGILYSNKFADGKELDKKLKITGEKTLKNSAGQSVITKQGVLPFLKLGNLVLKDVSAGFFAGDLKTQKVSYFGADLLRRFIWIFDAERKTVYFKPSKYFKEPYYKLN
ncbi:hypothetical protein ATE47_05425 [Chryseobacterium sp. IHB B 17019]|jgi:hypothetical protein|uniref:hypothetical protein n=1 Tax=Chryseobacterium sp. IHB B 17019 TaxID=1721091 RepID=UPI0007221434|nr:hypothetical protein [Chryseobacterium sp. IHB B 17019]ALR29998.1 hypothetical protein ATE47_05425 [Chryseobacterium sp. IHB B 17019]